MRTPGNLLAVAFAISLSAQLGLPVRAAAAGFTLLYSADERGEITPCG